MFGKFLPKETSFFDYFNKHSDIIAKASQEFLIMVNEDNFADRAKKITAMEKEADVIIHHCVEALHKTFITPFERNDIYQLISNMDDIIDYIEDAAVRIVLYQITQITPAIKELAKLLDLAVQEVQQLVLKLEKMEKSVFTEGFIRIHTIENQADQVLRDALKELFEKEKDPVTILKLKEIYEILEDGVDRCELVSNIVEGVIIEHS